MKYAIGRLRSNLVARENWELFQSLLSQALIADLSALLEYAAVLTRHNEAGYALSRDIIEPFLNRIITTSAVYHYHHEVCWALWLLLANGFSVSKETGKALSSSDNSLVCLMALDAQRQGRTQEPLQTTAWENMMDGEALFDRQWLLAYEANVKGWLPSKNGDDYLNDNEFFKELRTRDVQFYNPVIDSTGLAAQIEMRTETIYPR